MKMNRRYDYHDEEKDKEFNISSMTKYLKEKHEIDKELEKIITPYIKSKKLKILDACCGVGHISHFLSKISPETDFLGIDQTSYLIEEAKKLSDDKHLHFEVGDIYDMPEKYEKSFDISVCWKTLSWLPYYDEIMKSLISCTKRYIFLSALFYEGEIDFQIKVREYKKEKGKNDFTLYYNVYSLPRFKKFVLEQGVKNIDVCDFNIKVDIPKSDRDYMGTYTKKMADGNRLQISGAVVMFWKIIKIEI
jgi:ubiquinone/menaquinone biosynthesis C-methylase UbiE